MKKKPYLRIIYKITIAYILMVIIPITLVTSIAYYQFYEKEKSSLSRTQLNILSQTEEKLDYISSVSDTLSKAIAKDRRLINYLSNGDIEMHYSEEEFYASVSPLFEYSLIRQMIKYHSTTIYIHDYSVEEMGFTFFHDDKLTSQQWFNDFQLSKNQTLWLPPHSKESLSEVDNDNRKVYSYCRKLYSGSNDYLGLLVINIYEEDFYKGFSGLYQYPTDFHFIDYSNNSVYSSSQALNFEIENIKENDITHLPNSYISNNRFYTYTYIENMDLYLCISSPIHSQLFLSPQLLTVLIISTLCLIFIVFFFYKYVRNIFNIINNKIIDVNYIIQNNFKERLQIERNDEIGDISKSFNVLLDKINTLIKDVVTKETAQKDARLKALQYQINPHFIYNTIEIFSNKVELIGEYETSDALASFGKMLRYNLKNDTLFSTIAEELQHVKAFVKIEKIKYGDNLSCNIFCTEELNTVKIIRFIMQPIVENCFTHGFGEPCPDMKININIIANEDVIEFSIADNGKGIDPTYCKVLNEVFKTSNYKHPDFKNAENLERIGLMNINERLKLFYNPNCHITLSQLQGFTMISFRLPL